MVDAVKYPLLAPSILPESSQKCEVRHYSNRRRRLSGWRILGVFSIFFFKLFNCSQLTSESMVSLRGSLIDGQWRKARGRLWGRYGRGACRRRTRGHCPPWRCISIGWGQRRPTLLEMLMHIVPPPLETANGATPALLEQHPMVHVLVAMHII